MTAVQDAPAPAGTKIEGTFIDAVVQFKINHLHLHLTDDQGWRLEIDGWPRLTEVSGSRGRCRRPRACG